MCENKQGQQNGSPTKLEIEDTKQIRWSGSSPFYKQNL